MRTALRRPAALLVLLSAALLPGGGVGAAELLVGAASGSITPSEPVALSGQFHTRIARSVESPVTATALALETRRGDERLDAAVMVSCDLVAIREGIIEKLREHLKERLPDLDGRKVFLCATHTHTAPVMLEGKYEIPSDGVMQPGDYVEFLIGRLGEIIVKAWQGRQPGRVAWGLGHAVVGHNRRAVYANGSARMYGKTNVPAFRHIEGYEDHGVEMLFFFDRQGKPLAMAIDVACPSQEVEGRSAVNADFWHEVRCGLKERHSEDLCVLGLAGGAGDQSPHLMFRKAAEERMRRLRGLTRLEEIARRIVRAVDGVYDVVKGDVRTDVVLKHHVEDLQLPMRMVTEEEYARAKAAVESLSGDPRQKRRMAWHQATVDRYENREDRRFHDAEVHVVRLGDVAVATNPFELFTDYAVRIKARSKAVQTLVIQLAGSGTYLPSERAVRGGGYSAVVESSRVGPEGGQVLVDRTVEMIGDLWDESQ